MIEPAKIQVRFSDLDVLGHVNNAVYLSYFELTRVHYFKILLGENWDWNTNGVLLVRNELDYRHPVLLHDQPEVIMHTAHIGEKSFVLGYELSVNNVIYTLGKSTLVSVDSQAKKTTAIPLRMRECLEQLIK